MPTPSFPCTRCGACCRRVGDVDPSLGSPCMHLTADNECAIYETRPFFCRVDDMRPKGWTAGWWHTVNAVNCNKLQEDDDMPPKYRLRLL